MIFFENFLFFLQLTLGRNEAASFDSVVQPGFFLGGLNRIINNYKEMYEQ